MFHALGSYVLDDHDSIHATCHGPDREADALLLARLLNAWQDVSEERRDPFLPAGLGEIDETN